jgi:plastocyanin
MRSFVFLCLLCSFQVNASFTVNVVDHAGDPVIDAVLTIKEQSLAVAHESTQPTAIMDQVGMQFEPHVLIVNKGQLVSFPNSDDTRHHVYSFSKPKVFELKLYKGTQSEPVAMETPGIVELGCNIHDQMLGFIYVDNTGTAIKTNSNGQVTFQTSPPDSIMVWHPRLNQAKGTISEYPLNATDSEGNFTVVIDLKTPQVEKADTGFKSRFKRKLSDAGN